MRSVEPTLKVDTTATLRKTKQNQGIGHVIGVGKMNKQQEAKSRAQGHQKKKGLDGKACWDGYKLAGTKMKGGKKVDNCVKM